MKNSPVSCSVHLHSFRYFLVVFFLRAIVKRKLFRNHRHSFQRWIDRSWVLPWPPLGTELVYLRNIKNHDSYSAMHSKTSPRLVVVITTAKTMRTTILKCTHLSLKRKKCDILTPDFGLTHFLLPTCCKDPPAVKLNWCPSQDEYKPRITPSWTAPIGFTHLPLLVCFRLPFCRTNSNLIEKNAISD